MWALLFPLVYLSQSVLAIDSLKVAFQWKQLNFEYPSPEARWEASTNKRFIPEYNIPLGMEIYDERIFITVPRLKEGVAASLAYIKKSDPSDSPLLRPYPNWEAHDQSVDVPEIVSAFRIRSDNCGRLWVLDAGIKNLLDKNEKQVVPPRVLIYDLNTDKLLRVYEIPDKQWVKGGSFFANIVVEENNCNDSFAYLADIDRPALVVYDLNQNKSWMVQHHFFNVDPMAGNMTVAGVRFQWSDGIFGLSLSDKDLEGYSTLYFHPVTSFNEFTVSTKVLRNETLLQDSSAVFHKFKLLGSRGPKAESGVSFLHKKTGVLFYALIHLNAVACWRTALPNYTMESQGRIFMSDELMVFPNEIKVDANDTLWVLSDKLPIFMYKYLNYREYNFRILKSSVKEAITGTSCDSKMTVKTPNQGVNVKSELFLTTLILSIIIATR